MEAQAALVRTNGTVELHSVAEVDMYLALVVHPWHTEGNDTLRLHQSLYDSCFLKFGVLVVHVLD